MNGSQKISAWIFATAIAATIVYAPWERDATITDLGHVTLQELHSEIWEPPIIRNQTPNQNIGEVRLRTEVLIMEWIAACLIYAPVFFAFSDKNKNHKQAETEPDNLESKEIK